MKIIDAISGLDLRRPGNVYTTEEKLAWLSELDGQIKLRIMDICIGEEIAFVPYSSDTDLETELLVPHPFDGIYISWLCACVDNANGNTAAYQNSAALYNEQFNAYQAYYIRTCRPKSCGKQFF